MRFRGIYLSTLLWLAVGLAAAAGRPLYRDASQPVEARVADLMSRMTLREKVLQLQNRAVGAQSEIPSTFRGEGYGVTHEMSRDAAEVSRIYVALQKYMRDSTRLGIPVIYRGFIASHLYYFTYQSLFSYVNHVEHVCLFHSRGHYQRA